MLLSALMDFILTKYTNITHGKFWLIFLECFFIITIFINGISLNPTQHYQRLSENPFITRTDIAPDNYWQETVLLPLIAYYTYLSTPLGFTTLSIMMIITAYSLFIFLTFNHFGRTPTLIFTIILITNPLTMILFTWLGTPDSLTFALTIPFLFTNSYFLIFVLALLGTTNHVVFIFAATEILILRWVSPQNIKNLHLIIAIIGGATGYMLIKLFLALNQIQAMSRLDYILAKNLTWWLMMNLTNFPITIFSLFNVQWFIILICFIMFFAKDKRYYSFLAGILLFNYGIVFFTTDTTRIFALLSWGILIHCLFHSYRLSLDVDKSYHKEFLQALIIIGIISFISPRYYSWGGEIHTTPFYELIQPLFK